MDFNKIDVLDEEGWFKNVFVTGPGFQMAQIFVESIFEKHVDWVKLIQDDDNYKNILQVKIQKKFQDTPHYIEINHDDESGYHMGVYLCLGQKIHEVKKENAVNFATYGSFDNIYTHMENNGKIFVFLGKGIHKIKRKAEQMACEETLKLLD